MRPLLICLCLQANLLQSVGADAEESRFSEVFPDVAILFIDLAGAGRWTQEMPSIDMINLLNDVFTALDGVVEACGQNPAEAGVFKGDSPNIKHHTYWSSENDNGSENELVI